LEQQLRVEAELAARGDDLPQRREIDRVLPLVVRGAAPVPPLAGLRELPWGATVAPLMVVAGDDVAMTIGEHRRQRRILDPFGEEEWRRAGDGVVPDLRT